VNDRMTPREGFFLRHDLLVPLLALCLVGAGSALAADALVPGVKRWTGKGTSFTYPADWLAVANDDNSAEVRGEDAITRIVFESWLKPTSTLVTCDAYLELDRAQRYPLYERLGSGGARLGGKDWLMTHFAYAAKAGDGHAPQVVHAVEYAYPADFAVNRAELSIVTLHASAERLPELEAHLAASLRVE
jgi:hypothetical protein